MTDQACLNLRWALALIDGLIEGGLRQLVLSPGSRSTPVVLAAQRRSALTLTPILDERSAAFYALGLARASGRPVALLCTSGSAPAHWLPAVIEADESRLPLILLSADRPPELRGWGANQTIDQGRLFAPFVREQHDPGPAHDGDLALKAMRALGARAASISRGVRPGPVHLNLPFREPLVPTPDCSTPEATLDTALTGDEPPAGWHHGTPTPELARVLDSRLRGRGLICCGPGTYPSGFSEALWTCAARLAVPVLCDPLSGLRFGPGGETRITRYDSLLRNPQAAAALAPDWVLRFGRAPVSKVLLGWLTDRPTVLVDAGAGWSDPSHDVRLRLAVEPTACCNWLAANASPADPTWLAGWMGVERRLDAIVDDYLATAPWCEGQLVTGLLDRLHPGDGLLCANSMPIRQLDTWSGTRATALQVFGNRGASGIDGQASTLAGLNAGGVPSAALLGDLSFIHDLGGLALLERLDRPCIVLNNGGGRIFDYLPQHGQVGFERLWRTPQALDLEALTRTFGLPHRRVEDAEGFQSVLADALQPSPQGSGVIEVRIDAECSRRMHQTFWDSIRGTTII